MYDSSCPNAVGMPGMSWLWPSGSDDERVPEVLGSGDFDTDDDG